ncbi:MAG: hypothetical protein ACYC2Y_04805 [Armatimonadota bacterium]
MRQQNKPSPKRRWVIIGPGLVLALILALQIVVRNHRTTAEPIIERQVIGVQTERGYTPALEVSYILERRDVLRLSERQQESLRKLQSEGASKSKPLTDSLDEAANDFQAFMKKTGGKATVRDIQTHSGQVSELSREVSSLRRVYWEKALMLLDERQKAIVRQELPRPGKTDESRENQKR